MSEPDGARRLRGGGVGSVLGGLAVGAFALVASYPTAAGAVLGIGIAGFVAERGRSLDSRISLGFVAVGGIGLLEATGTTAVGIDPFLLASFGVTFGLIDIGLSSVLGRAKNRSNGER
ncbi:uncharacterized protein NP_3550A [Natronomonas pharaonis DSM 2160]|uniref:Uncharacterized protein n=1 Tax=Natronomonas pharaonis (strain ATCC 35678 / DSM 2160 / CIP 103997 / JCM 8858 / NBRC 14720 / NCIMB 2260 / Gabara) TaxID=348780 RepID=A0A1U7EXI1_NATPD|nr:hypothetical protein [Natronomonas pharaonis]CAI49866.1 uncharacterized protein NP_3550A [Natronomonas pharaonis DSM 2160]